MTTPKLKLELTSGSLGAFKTIPLIRALKTRPQRSSEVSVFFDTEKLKLREHGLILRVQRVGDHYIQSVKATRNSGPFDSGEWEAEVAGRQPDLRLASGTALESLAIRKLGRQLKPLFEVRTHRTIYSISDDTRAIALRVDRGTIDTGTNSAPLCEVELRIERGNVTALFEIARELTQSLPARLAVKSDAERGYELIDGTLNTPLKAVPIDLAGGLSTQAGLQAIGYACLRQIIGNEPALTKGDPEGVHQMRVGLRRLRAAISLFGDLLHDPQTAAIKTELKWLAKELTLAREFDVLMERVVTPAKKQGSQWNGIPPLAQALIERRDGALTKAQKAVTSARFRSLTIELAAWLEAGQWTHPQDGLGRDRGEIPIKAFGAEQLTRRWRKVRKKRRLFVQMDVQRRHRLRIQTKKLRYAAEFFAGLFSGKRSLKRKNKLLPALERLQDALGDLNDIAVDEKIIAEIGMRRRSDARQAFATGLLTGREDARFEAAMATSVEAYGELMQSKPFWL
jgi:inorganic triphosphatase YgiF